MPLLRIRLQLRLQRRKFGEGRIRVRLLLAALGTRTLVGARLVALLMSLILPWPALAVTLAIVALWTPLAVGTFLAVGTIMPRWPRSARLTILGLRGGLGLR